MKTKKWRIAKNTLAFALSVLMIVSAVLAAPAQSVTDVVPADSVIQKAAETVAQSNFTDETTEQDNEQTKSKPADQVVEQDAEAAEKSNLIEVKANHNNGQIETVAEQSEGFIEDEPVADEAVSNHKEQAAEENTSAEKTTATKPIAVKGQLQTSGESSSTYTLYFKKSQGDWTSSDVWVYAWNGGSTGNWPGTQMTSLGNNIYSCNVPIGTKNVIFNDSNIHKTVDLSVNYNYHKKIYDCYQWDHDGTGDDKQKYYSGGWEMYDSSSSSSSTATFSNYFLYGSTNNPTSMVNTLPVQYDSSKSLYYVEYTPEINKNFYFGLSGSKLYTSLYHQGSGKSGSFDYTTDSTLTLNTDLNASVQEFNIGNTRYNFSRVNVTNSNIKTLRIYFANNADGYHFQFATPSSGGDTVTVYAKSGTIRDSWDFTDKYSKLATTTVGYANGDTLNVDYTQWKYMDSDGNEWARLGIANAEKGKTITIKTTLKDNYKSTYYVKAFCINGETYGLLESEPTSYEGVYTLDYTIPEDQTGDIEITPIYYYFEGENSAQYVTLSVEDFAGDVKALWGNTIACYAYYATNDGVDHDVDDATSASKPALGGYPGQPLVYINGSYYMQLPKSVNDKPIEGITLNNYIWDDIHSEKLNNITGSLTEKTSAKEKANCQTYDFDDFAPLYQRGAERIIFNFKYRTYNNVITETGNSDYPYAWDKGNTTSTTNSTSNITNVPNANDWDVLVDYYDHPVDLFARRITKTDDTSDYYTDSEVKNDVAATDKVYVVSDGYVPYYYGSTSSNKFLGQYATRWFVYKYNGSSYSYIGALPPSAFLTGLKDDATKYTPIQMGTRSDKASEDTTESKFRNYSTAARGYMGDLCTWTDYTTIYNACAGLPVVITYESSIYSQGKTSTTANPGYRCDGRWYYSLPAAAEAYVDKTISGQTKIMIIDKDYQGNILYNSNGTIHYSDDAYVTPSDVTSHKGSITNADAYLNNTTPLDIHGESFQGKTYAQVTEDESNSFLFKATSTSVGNYTFKTQNANTYEVSDDTSHQEEVTFRFIGWYLETGSGLLNFITSNPEGSRQMDSFGSFVAVYEPIQARTLIVEHTLYKDLYETLSADDKAKTTAPSNGTDGTPYIESVTITKTTENDGATETETIYSFNEKVNGNDYNVTIDPMHLSDNDAIVTVTLSTTPGSDTAFNSVYIPTKSGETDLYADNTISTSTNTLVNAAPTKITNNTITYTYRVGDLFPTASDNGIVTLNHYSDLISTKILVKFYYYDRVVSETSHIATIKEEPDHVDVYASQNRNDTTSPANAVLNALSDNVNSPMKKITNVIDQYYFWPTQDVAVEGVKALPNYHSKKTEAFPDPENFDASYNTYSSSYTDTELSYHFDCYGTPLKDSTVTGYTAKEWVTYRTKTGTTDVLNSDTSVDGLNIEYIEVWAYNVPKTYKVTLTMPSTGDTDETLSALSGTTGIYVGDDVVKSYAAFYNQRIGGEDKLNETANESTDYLKAYGVTQPYTASTNDEITAPASVVNTISENKVTYVFDGWYDSANGTKVSSDRTYGYRVTAKLDLVAGYKIQSNETVKAGLSVTNGGVESYIDENNDQRVRLATVLNVFNNLDENGKQIDSDPKIQNISTIYVQLPVKDSDQNTIKWTSDMIDDLGLKEKIENHIKTTPLVNGTSSWTETLTDGSGKVITFTYSVTFDSSKIDSTTTMLTNKNRVQFTLPMKAEYYYGENGDPGVNSAIVSFGAMKYNGQWVVSDNYAAFIADPCKP